MPLWSVCTRYRSQFRSFRPSQFYSDPIPIQMTHTPQACRVEPPGPKIPLSRDRPIETRTTPTLPRLTLPSNPNNNPTHPPTHHPPQPYGARPHAATALGRLPRPLAAAAPASGPGCEPPAAARVRAAAHAAAAAGSGPGRGAAATGGRKAPAVAAAGAPAAPGPAAAPAPLYGARDGHAGTCRQVASGRGRVGH